MSSPSGDGWEKNITEDENKGLFRTVLAGAGHTLADAFANLERAPHVERVSRHSRRDLLGARVSLAPEEGEGYWEVHASPRRDFCGHREFRIQKPSFALSWFQGDGLIQFNFRLSGDLTLAVSRSALHRCG